MKRHTPSRPPVACVALAALAWLGACGGSSSETPWPVEPIDTDPAPVGETRPGDEEARPAAPGGASDVEPGSEPGDDDDEAESD